jgi:hypothetical protein
VTSVTSAARPRRTKQRANGEGSIFQLKDGTWVAHTTYYGKAVRRKGKTRREAAAKLKSWLKLRESGIDPQSDGWTLYNWLDHWLADTVKPRYDDDGVRYQGREEPTYANYERSVRRYIKPYFRDSRSRSFSPNTSKPGSAAWPLTASAPRTSAPRWYVSARRSSWRPAADT